MPCSGEAARVHDLGILRLHFDDVTPKWPGNLRELAVETQMNSASIFDLSPSEKLQLVEDLWDDLAAAPEGVPVHDWQEQELARRKANLLKHPASGLPWEEVKRKVRARYAR
jgi:putative addiction module component (TIGR02574 family)